jgi:ATP-dependent helicase/nuclease subunit B
MAEAARPSLFTIPPHRSFADSLAAGLIARYGDDPLALAGGRILLPNTRAVRALTEAFVRASGSGLVLPRLVAIGDPEFDDRIGGALDPADLADPLPPAIAPLDRQLALAAIIARSGEGSAEAMRLAADLARTLDQLIVEEIAPARLAEVAGDDPELAAHWQHSLDRLQAILVAWPEELRRRGAIDLTERRNRLLRATARRWTDSPPPGLTVAAGITTAAPAVAALLRTIADLPDGMVVLPGLALEPALPEAEWQALGPDERGRSEPGHPQYHLKLLLDRMGAARGEVRLWPRRGRFASPPARSLAVINAMTLPAFTAKWQPRDRAQGSGGLAPHERRLSGVTAAEFADPASEAMGIAVALRGALEEPGRTAALVTPDRTLAARVAAILARWDISADDSAGRPLSQTPAGTLLLGIAAAAAERVAPVALLALLKHPLAGGEGAARMAWLSAVRELDLALRGPRPPAGLDGLDRLVAEREAGHSWHKLRPAIAALDGLAGRPLPLAALVAAVREVADSIAGGRAWRGPDGRVAAELVAGLEAAADSALLAVDPDEWVPLLRALMDQQSVRAPYGGHPRIFIWGLIEGRLQHADLMILGGLNEGVWPALPAPDPWLAPSVRSALGLPGLDTRIGLAAHDFASALGAPRVLVTRARRDSRAPTVASRLWLRLQAMTGGLVRDHRLERWAGAIDRPAEIRPAERPAPAPPAAARPKKISVTRVDRLKADPYAFYASQMLRLNRLDPVDAEQSAAWKGSAVHETFQAWFDDDRCDPDALLDRARKLLAGDAIHPMLRALWQPRLLAAIDWLAGQERDNRAAGRTPLAAEADGTTNIGGITLYGRADRIDRLADGRLGIVDYKTGKPPAQKAIDAGFALQLGLLGLIARDGGFEGIEGLPGAHEYWSLAKDNSGEFGFCQRADAKAGADALLAEAERNFLALAADYLAGDKPFTAKLHPAYAPYGDYDQLMRLDEWYGRAD